MNNRTPYVWDYDISEEQFSEILSGAFRLGRLDREWALVRLLEHAPYPEVIQRIGFKVLIEEWPRVRGRIRSNSRRRGFDFLVAWIPSRHPDLLS
jgi:hypothetical protein